MKVTYKGFEITAERDKCLGGWSMLYFSIFNPDGDEIISSFEDSAEKVRDKINQLKETVDDYIANPQDYVEQSQ